MIKNQQKWEKFEREEFRKRKLDVDRNFKIYEELYLEAKSLGIFPLKDPLHGLEHCIELAKRLNALSTST